MRKSFLYIIFGLLSLVFFSCEKQNCLSGAGSVTNKERELPDFRIIEIYDHLKIYLQSDTINKISIETGEKLIPYIETYVQNDTLIIKDNNTCNFLKNYPEKKIVIHSNVFRAIDVYGSSDIYTIDTLKLDTFKIRFLSDVGSCNLTVNAHIFELLIWYTSGNFLVSGYTYSSYLSAERTSFIYADKLENEICRVNNNSKGDIYALPGKIFYYSIRNAGNIYYSGTPDTIIVQKYTGSGKLIKLN